MPLWPMKEECYTLPHNVTFPSAKRELLSFERWVCLRGALLVCKARGFYHS